MFFPIRSKTGVQARYYRDFDADQQFGKVDYNTDALQLNYSGSLLAGQEFRWMGILQGS